jgi:hypothetical protein
MSFSQMTTAAFSSGRKNVEELLATARRFWGRERQQAKAIKAGRALRAQLDFARYLQKRTADPSHTFRDHLRNIDGVIEEKVSPNLLSLSFLASFSTSERSPSTPYRTSSDGINITLLRPHCWLITRRRDLARSHPDIDVEHKIRVESDNKRCA